MTAATATMSTIKTTRRRIVTNYTVIGRSRSLRPGTGRGNATSW
jgi:hypothetical protein